MNPSITRLPALVLVAGLALVGCSAGGGDSAGTTGLDAPASRVESAEGEAGGLTSGTDEAGSTARSADLAAAEAPAAPGQLSEPAIISIGTITLQSDDVAAARFDLEKVVDSYGGTIADEKTTASTDGEVRLSRVVLRIPSDDFDAAMIDLAELGKVTASTRKAQDVTAEVIDTAARIRAQEQSLERVEVLFARAQDIRDIVAIEAQLSRRQAALDSLKGQLAYLEDQTSLSTITVYLEKATEQAAAATKDDDTAFVAGLKRGWQALADVGAGLATLTGVLLPFAVVALVLGVPAAVATRRVLRRHPVRHPTVEV